MSAVYCQRCDYDMHQCKGCGEPLPHGLEACAKCGGRQSVELDPVTAAWYAAIAGWDAEIAALTEKRKRAAEVIQQAMGDADQATISGRPAVTWAWSKPGQRLDRTKLEEAYGKDVITRYLVDNKPARPFRIIGDSDG